MKRIVIIGAGLAGLTAARELLRRGDCTVTILERAARPGGLAITLASEGRRTDIGPHRINTELPEAQAVFDEMPAALRVVTRRKSRMLAFGGEYRFPPSVLEMARRMPLRSMGFGLSLLRARLGGAGPAESGDTGCGGLLRALYGARLAEAFFIPYFRKVWKSDPDDLDPEIIRVRVESGRGGLLRAVRPRSVREVRYLRGGIEALVRKLTDDVTRAGGAMVLGADVVGLEGAGRTVQRVIVRREGKEERFDADCVLSTAPIAHLPAWFASMAPAAATAMQAAAAPLETLRLILIGLHIQRERMSPDHWIYFPEDGIRLNRLHEPKNFDASMAPPGQSLVCAEITCRGADADWQAADADLIGRTVEELRGMGFDGFADPPAGLVYRTEYAYPLYHRGFRRDLHRLLEALADFDNVVPFGRQGLFCHNNMDHSIVMGLRAARAAMTDAPARAMRACDEEFQRFRIVD